MKVLREIFLLPVHVYRAVLSPLKGQPTCRYTPSCSEYFLLSVRKFGIFKGTALGISRLLRCRNRYFGGPDPVPDTFSWKYIKDQYTARRKPRGFDREMKKNSSSGK